MFQIPSHVFGVGRTLRRPRDLTVVIWTTGHSSDAHHVSAPDLLLTFLVLHLLVLCLAGTAVFVGLLVRFRQVESAADSERGTRPGP